MRKKMLEHPMARRAEQQAAELRAEARRRASSGNSPTANGTPATAARANGQRQGRPPSPARRTSPLLDA